MNYHQSYSYSFANWCNSIYCYNAALDLMSKHHLKPKKWNSKYERQKQKLNQKVCWKKELWDENFMSFQYLPPKCTEKIAKREILNKPRVQKTQLIGRLNKCGHDVFDSLPLSFWSRSSSSSRELWNLGRISVSTASGNELEPVLDTIETGLELRDVATELGSDGKLCRGRWAFLCAEFVDDVVIRVVVWAAVAGALLGRSWWCAIILWWENKLPHVNKLCMHVWTKPQKSIF